MKKNIKVSIITPSYNQGQFIEAAILSILGQTYKNIEYIIVDGGSTDNTMEIVEKYKDRIDIVIHEKDKGQSDAINKGFRLATGELAGWLNSDDILYPACIENIVNLYYSKPDGSIYYVPVQDGINAAGIKHNTAIRKIPNKRFLLNKDYSIVQPSSFYPNQILMEINYVNENLNYCMDLDLWLRLLDHGPIYYTDDQAAQSAFRNWGASKTTTGGDKFIKEIAETLRNHGGKFISRNIITLYYFLLKFRIKQIVRYGS